MITIRSRFALLASLLAGFAFSTVPGPRATAHAQSGRISLPDARIYYETAGRGRAVVFIHGWALNLREWDDQVKALTPQYRAVAYDRRGFGKSEGFPDVSADAGDLAALLDTLGIRSAVVVGHSAGAGVSLRFAHAYPARVEALVLYGGAVDGFPIPPTDAPPFGNIPAIARQHGLDSMWKFVGSLPMFWNPPDRPDITQRILGFRAAYSGRDLLEPRPPSDRFPAPPFDWVKQLRTPTLFVTGEREWAYFRAVADSMARWMPNAKSVVIAGGAHGVHFAQAARFNATLLEFLRSVGK